MRKERSITGRLQTSARALIGGFMLAAVSSGSTASEPYLGPVAIVASEKSDAMFVACADARKILHVDLSTGKVARRLDAPAAPTGLALSRDGTKLVVTCAGPRSTVCVIDWPALQRRLQNPSAGTTWGTPNSSSDTLGGSYGLPAVNGIPNSMGLMTAVNGIPNSMGLMTGVRQRVAILGKGPRGVAVVGSKVYIAGYFSDTVDVVDLRGEKPTRLKTISLGPKPKMDTRRFGEMLFHDATICYQHWQSCSSCHPDARSDVLNWDLRNDGVGNPKNTRSMLLAHRTPPAMATGIRPTAEAAVRAGIRNTLFTDRPEAEAAAIDAYFRALQPVPSPYLVDGRLSPAAQRGKRWFESDRVGCHRCHPAPLYTDLSMHDVDTRGSYDMSSRFDTPTLIEVWRTAPYLHDGRYTTIEELIVEGRHGLTRGRLERLTKRQIADLVEFVLSL